VIANWIKFCLSNTKNLIITDTRHLTLSHPSNTGKPSSSDKNKHAGEGTIITKSSKGSSTKKEINSRKEQKRDRGDKDRSDKSRIELKESSSKRKRRRRQHSSSESESDDGRGAVVDEEILWEQREKRREELHERRKKKKDRDAPDNLDEEKLSKLTDQERADLEREKDKRERDEFAKRLVEKDKRKQRIQLDESDYSGSDEDRRARKEENEAKRMERLKRREDRDRRLARGEEVVLESDDEEDGAGSNRKKKAISISDMRAESRRAYLQKRTKRELELLERELKDEEEIIAKLGGSSKMTEEEKRELQLKRDILRMAREHGHVETDEAEAAKKPDGFYRLPEDFDGDDDTGKKKTRAQKGEELLTSRYVEPKQEKSEQELWEEGQTQMAAGLARHKKKKRTGEDEDDDDKYDFVFEEEQIDFVCAQTNKGYDNRKKQTAKNDDDSAEPMTEEEKALEMRPATKHEKILEGRKKLPVYPYR
jgi:pre-mRNA-splicing factor ATP-dependent RNA helicase DHX16